MTVEDACLEMLRQNRIPTVRACRAAGCSGNNATLARAVMEFKREHVEEIESLRVAHGIAMNETSRRGALSYALEHYRRRVEELEAEIKSLKANQMPQSDDRD